MCLALKPHRHAYRIEVSLSYHRLTLSLTYLSYQESLFCYFEEDGLLATLVASRTICCLTGDVANLHFQLNVKDFIQKTTSRITLRNKMPFIINKHRGSYGELLWLEMDNIVSS